MRVLAAFHIYDRVKGVAFRRLLEQLYHKYVEEPRLARWQQQLSFREIDKKVKEINIEAGNPTTLSEAEQPQHQKAASWLGARGRGIKLLSSSNIEAFVLFQEHNFPQRTSSQPECLAPLGW
jgi:hypothetical protein